MQAQRDGRNDFDFLVGKWKGLNQRLRERLVGSTDWEVFEGRLVMHKILGGLGNFDEATLYRESGQAEGANLRLYNPDTGEWSIYWASSAGANNLFPPMVGKFDNGRGVFTPMSPSPASISTPALSTQSSAKMRPDGNRHFRQMVGKAGKPTGYAISRGKNNQSGVKYGITVPRRAGTARPGRV